MGTEKAAIAHVVVLLERHEDHKRLETAAAVLDADTHVDDVVKHLIRDVPVPEKSRKR
jgi:hypothetical protein